MPFSESPASVCSKCKGRLWCGKDRCPLLVKFYTQAKVMPLIDSTSLEGSSPPSVFIGSYNYPKVFIGPMVPPIHGDTSMMDTPEMWSGKTIEEIVDFRFQLVRGKFLTDVQNFEGKIVEKTREIALADISAETEIEFKTKPTGRMIINDDVQPFGPSAALSKLDVGSYTFDRKVEKAFYDMDLKAKDAIIKLYEDNVLVSKIQKAFSVGAFGLEKNRRFVPTRWSITAVDDMLSKNLVEKVKDFPLINEFRVYEHVQLDNMWIVLMVPREWSYEQLEGWHPRTLWNPDDKVSVISDWEGNRGKKTYAATGGCYYSTRLGIAERLLEERRQATAITFREINPGYIMPVGVWHTRESIRAALKKPALKFSTLGDSLDYISKKLKIPLKEWVDSTHLLRQIMNQKRLSDFLAIKSLNTIAQNDKSDKK
ncbi:MAG: Nre family DNA repair protein [Candidatus Aenigmatarchaeota archaeon]